MSRRARLVVFVACAVVLCTAASILTLGRGDDPQAPQHAESRAVAERDDDAEELLGALRRQQHHTHLAAGRGHDTTSEARDRDRERVARAGEGAALVAIRFYAAFSLYELGDLGPETIAGLRRGATGRFARDLIAMPPRVPAGAELPERGELTRLEFVPGDVDPNREVLLSGQLVGRVERDGARSPIALELVRTASGWRVAGIGG